MENRDLGTIATELGGIGNTLHILCAAIDPKDGTGTPTASFQMSLFALAEYCSRLQEELDDAHMRLEVKPLNQTA